MAATHAKAAGLAAVALFGDDRNVEADQWADVGRDEAVGADDLDHTPAARERDADLGDARIAGAGGGVNFLAQCDLLRERDQCERIVPGVHRAVGAGGRRSGNATSGIEQLERLRGAVDRGGTNLVSVAKSGHFARHPAQAKT